MAAPQQSALAPIMPEAPGSITTRLPLGDKPFASPYFSVGVEICQNMYLEASQSTNGKSEYYLGSADLIRQRIGEITDDITELLVIGHSPGIPTLAAELAWATQPRQADQIQCWFPTAAHSEFEIDSSWSELWNSDGDARLAEVRRPKRDI